jgi:hypothetical protein
MAVAEASFQYIQAGDIVRVDIIHAAAERDTVQHQQRLVQVIADTIRVAGARNVELVTDEVAIDRLPRMRICPPPPGVALLFTMSTPAVRPCSSLMKLGSGTSARVVAVTLATEPVTSLAFWVPYPTTITWSSEFDEAANVICKVCRPATLMVAGA